MFLRKQKLFKGGGAYNIGMAVKTLREYKKLVWVLKIEATLQKLKLTKLTKPLELYRNYRRNLIEKVESELRENNHNVLHPTLEKDIYLCGKDIEDVALGKKDERDLHPKDNTIFFEPIHPLVRKELGIYNPLSTSDTDFQKIKKTLKLISRVAKKDRELLEDPELKKKLENIK